MDCIGNKGSEISLKPEKITENGDIMKVSKNKADTEFKFDVKTACCFSGHRPSVLPGNGDTRDVNLKRPLSILRLAIEDAINEGYTTFITGMARGVDMWAARFIMEIRLKRPDINLVCVLPYKDQSKDYPPAERYDYNMILGAAQQVVCLNDEYTGDCMRERNTYIVENSSKLIAVVKNYRSGTGMTINIAKKLGRDIRIIDVKSIVPFFKPQKS